MFQNASVIISDSQYRSSTFFDSIGYPNTAWSFTASPWSLELKKDYQFISVINNNGLTVLSDAMFMKRETYENVGYVFDTVWAIREGLEYPLLLARSGDVIAGGPGQSMKWVVFVKKSDNGSMYYRNEIYESLRKSVKISMFEGATGEQVTQTYMGPRYPDNTGKIYVYLASGVQDPDFPGGYGDYQPVTSRTVTLRADRSINVTFYYSEWELPNYNYLMRVSLPDELVHIAVLKEESVSEVKVQMHDGTVCAIPLVPLDDIQASDIRVAANNGIFALKKIELYD